jgi:DNA-directed RNA polymerase specialized sigma24 family protein
MHTIEDEYAEREFLVLAVERAFSMMTDKELLCFIMYYVCGIEQEDIGRALDGITHQAVSDNLKRAMGKARSQFAAMRSEFV